MSSGLLTNIVVKLGMVRSLKNFAHAVQASVANLMYGAPGKKITTIGVTGTDGKTTTASLIFHILKVAGANPAMITSVGAQILDREYETGLHITTPSSFQLQKYIKRAVESKCDYLVLEVTSHALDQNRVRNIKFEIGVLTNITHEHFDYHKTQDEYIKAKSKLFRIAATSILNMDDSSYDVLKSKAEGKVLSYSLKNKNADFNLKNIGVKLPGEYDFNFENFLASISVAKILNVPDDKIALALSSFKFPEGRQEIVYEKDFRVVIDFAHTPNSFARVLPVFKKATSGRLIHVFGAAGKRDRSKRPLMGEIAAKFDDVIVLTSEDSRNEKIEQINSQIKFGIKDFEGELLEIPDRQEAINYAVRTAKKGDTIVITGKGHEKSMNLGHGEIPWSDHEAVKSALRIGGLFGGFFRTKN